MRTTFYVFVILLLPICLFSQKSKEIIPPGTVKLNDSLFIDATEMRNIDYAEYCYWNKHFFGENSEEYKSCLPDTLAWSSKTAYNEPMVALYFQHPAYQQYPVVGVSYEQAVLYCEWRSRRVNEVLYLKENKLDYNTDLSNVDVPQKVHYRLPTVEEWQEAASLSYSEKTMKKMNSKKHQGAATDNFIGNIEHISDDMSSITAPVQSYWPNSAGIYCILGNVAEMTDVKGVAKGGAWNQKRDEFSVEKEYVYEKPECWIGFRCVCETVK